MLRNWFCIESLVIFRLATAWEVARDYALGLASRIPKHWRDQVGTYLGLLNLNSVSCESGAGNGSQVPVRKMFGVVILTPADGRDVLATVGIRRRSGLINVFAFVG